MSKKPLSMSDIFSALALERCSECGQMLLAGPRPHLPMKVHLSTGHVECPA